MKWFSDVTKTMAICSWMIMNTEVELPPTYATPFAFNHGWTSHVFKSQQCVMHIADEGFRYVSREELEHRSIRSYFRNGWQPYRTSCWHHSWNFFWHTWSIYLTWERNHHKLHIIIFLITVLCVLFYFSSQYLCPKVSRGLCEHLKPWMWLHQPQQLPPQFVWKVYSQSTGTAWGRAFFLGGKSTACLGTR